MCSFFSIDSLCKSNEDFVLREIGTMNENLMKRSTPILSGEFKDFAHFQQNGKSDRQLFHNGYFDNKNSGSHQRTFWLCSKYKKFRCKARAVTCVIDGYEMVKIRSTPHSHPPEF